MYSRVFWSLKLALTTAFPGAVQGEGAGREGPEGRPVRPDLREDRGAALQSPGHWDGPARAAHAEDVTESVTALTKIFLNYDKPHDFHEIYRFHKRFHKIS